MVGEKNGEALRFVADAALGRLARYLRMLGYDVAYIRDASGLAAWREEARTGRALLTRRRDLAAREGADALWVEADDVLAQLAATARRFRLALSPALMSRCLECNAVLESVTKADVEDRLPPHVRKTQERFTACPRCGRIYWPGTHYARAVARLTAALRGRDAADGNDDGRKE